MAWRYRRSVKVLPGVRLNFSKRGVSTTVGVRGASVNFSKRGTYLNTGIPGTGLYNRQKIGQRSDQSGLSYASAVRPVQVRKYKYHLWPWWIFGSLFIAVPRIPALVWSYWAVLAIIWIVRTARGSSAKHVETAVPETGVPLYLGPIQHDDTGSSDGVAGQLGTSYRAYVEDEHDRLVAEHRQKLAQAHFEKLQKGILSRRFARKRIASLADVAKNAQQEQERLTELIANLLVNADGSMSEELSALYKLVSESFAALTSSKAVWFVSSEAPTDLSLKSSASSSYDRQRLTLATEDLPFIHSAFPGIAFDAPDKKLHIYPDFVLIVHASKPFDLVRLAGLKIDFSSIRFVEEGQQPEDAKVVDHTWKKVNKDGSPDRRFSGNFQIPVMGYGELTLTRGGDEFKYLISNNEAGLDFAMKLAAYKSAAYPGSLGGTRFEDLAAKTFQISLQPTE